MWIAGACRAVSIGRQIIIRQLPVDCWGILRVDTLNECWDNKMFCLEMFWIEGPDCPPSAKSWTIT